MTAGKTWFPASRKERHALIAKTTAFTSVDANRILIGFGSDTPNGVWFDIAYIPKLTVYDAAYRKWDTPATSTLMALDDLKDAEKIFFPVYREFYAMAKASTIITNAYLEDMGFPPRPSGSRTPHPVDKTFITLHVKPLGNLVLSAAFEDRDTGKSIIPYYLTGAVIYYAVSDTPVTDQKELVHSQLATRSPLELIFDTTQRGKTVYLAARWQNRRGELGPWSEIIFAVIP
ncbi:MAG: hypothetical protein LBG45_06375 [Dysgonamonadaceae bacterium]|jgi:hypothetical protein|nr:hypothetical protein [Dysgonamonadaceae bacterium]